MSLDTQSAFRYGFEFTEENNVLQLVDENGSHTLTFPVGPLCLSEIASTMLKIFTASGLDDYLPEYDKKTCRIKISRTSLLPFDVLTTTGSLVNLGLYDLLNLDYTGDLLGVTEIESKYGVGKRFLPQFFLQSYIDCKQNKRLRQATKSESSSGECCEVLHCGVDQFFEFEIKLQTNIKQSHRFLPSRNGYDELIDFMDWAICAKPIEFLPDCNDCENIYKVKLSKTKGSKDGTGYRLVEMIRTVGCGYYRTGKLEFRVVQKPDEN